MAKQKDDLAALIEAQIKAAEEYKKTGVKVKTKNDKIAEILKSGFEHKKIDKLKITRKEKAAMRLAEKNRIKAEKRRLKREKYKELRRLKRERVKARNARRIIREKKERERLKRTGGKVGRPLKYKDSEFASQAGSNDYINERNRKDRGIENKPKRIELRKEHGLFNKAEKQAKENLKSKFNINRLTLKQARILYALNTEGIVNKNSTFSTIEYKLNKTEEAAQASYLFGKKEMNKEFNKRAKAIKENIIKMKLRKNYLYDKEFDIVVNKRIENKQELNEGFTSKSGNNYIVVKMKDFEYDDTVIYRNEYYDEIADYLDVKEGVETKNEISKYKNSKPEDFYDEDD